MSLPDRVERAGAAMLRRLMGRGTRPGMVDVASIREAAGMADAGLGLARSPLTRHLAARRTGDGASTVAGGTLVHPLRRGIAGDAPEDAGEDPVLALPDMPVPPRARPVPIAARASTPSPMSASPDAAAEAPVPTANPTTIPAASRATPSTPPAAAAAEGAASVPAIAAATMTGPAPSALVPRAAAVTMASDAGEDMSDLPLARSSPAGLAANAIAPDMLPMAGSTAPSSGAARAPRIEALPAPATIYGSPPPGVPGAPAAREPLGDISERVQRDLHRRLTVERERQGLARWKR